MDLSNLGKPEPKGILKVDNEEKPRKELLTAKKIMVSLRPSERLNIEKLAEEESLPLSTLIRKILKKHQYI